MNKSGIVALISINLKGSLKNVNSLMLFPTQLFSL